MFLDPTRAPLVVRSRGLMVNIWRGSDLMRCSLSLLGIGSCQPLASGICHGSTTDMS